MHQLRTAGAAAVLSLVFAGAPGCGSQPGDSAATAQGSQELERLREENKELQRLRAENRELPRLRRENEELARLREQTEGLAQLRQENEQLRAQLQSLRAPKTPAPRR
jgi:DNA repair exonuclease SbcCD ATPase subunit